MSGGGGGGAYGDGPSGTSDCAIVERVILSSPNPAVLSKLTVGQELDVLLVEKSLVAQPASGPPPAGSLTLARLADLLDCIGRGFSYKAVVLKVAGGRCDVEVRRK